MLEWALTNRLRYGQRMHTIIGDDDTVYSLGHSEDEYILVVEKGTFAASDARQKIDHLERRYGQLTDRILALQKMGAEHETITATEDDAEAVLAEIESLKSAAAPHIEEIRFKRDLSDLEVRHIASV